MFWMLLLICDNCDDGDDDNDEDDEISFTNVRDVGWVYRKGGMKSVMDAVLSFLS